MNASNLKRLSELLKSNRMGDTHPKFEETNIDFFVYDAIYNNVDKLDGLIDLIDKVEIKNKVIVEIGCYLGVSTEAFLLHEPKKMYAIDPWENYSEIPTDCFDEIEQKFRDRVKNYKNIEIIKNYSVEAAKDFKENSLDFVYIDGNHEYSYVSADIEAWWPKIRQGGYIGGHDFYAHMGHGTGVETAVYHYFGNEGHLDNHVEAFSDSSWLFKKL